MSFCCVSWSIWPTSSAVSCSRAHCSRLICWLLSLQWQIDYLFDCTVGKMMLLHLKSSLPPGFCMINRHLSLYISKKALVHMIFCVWTRYASAQSFLEKISPCFMVTNSEYQASPHGEGTGDEARLKIM